jgi:hypothetical protein
VCTPISFEPTHATVAQAGGAVPSHLRPAALIRGTAVEPLADENGSSDIVHVWGEHSFPASDPPANW